jgi:hypothetical protein
LRICQRSSSARPWASASREDDVCRSSDDVSVLEAEEPLRAGVPARGDSVGIDGEDAEIGRAFKDELEKFAIRYSSLGLALRRLVHVHRFSLIPERTNDPV